MEIIQSKGGKKVFLLTPSERKEKYKKELGDNISRENCGSLKCDPVGNYVRLTKGQRVWRSGFNSGVTSCQKAYWGKKKRMGGK